MDAMREAEAFQKSSNFAFDKWLEEHKIEDAKQVFIKYNMTTFNNLSMQNENIALFIADIYTLGKSGLIKSILPAIQSLDKHKTELIYIVPSQKERAAMETIKKQTNAMHNLKNEFTKTQNKWNDAKRSNNNQVEKKYQIYFTELENIKNKIAWYIQQLTSEINNTHNTLNNQITKYQKTVHDTINCENAKQKQMNDILKRYSMTINESIKHYKSKIVECRNILKEYSIN
eukprot:456708_1